MDPLSVIASVVALLQLTTTLMTYFNHVKNATTDQRRIAVEAGNLYGLLITLRGRVEEAQSADDPWFTQVKALGGNDGPLEQLKSILEKMVEQVGISGSRNRVKSNLLWTFARSDVDAALNQMERLKSLINLAMSNDAFKLTQAVHNTVTDVHLGVQRLLDHADRDVQIKLSKWLRVPDPSTNYRNALKKRHLGTGSWLLTAQQFHDWKNSASSLLWLYGKAGCGKTVLSATALENVLSDTTAQSDTMAAYFYFNFNDNHKQHSSAMVRSLLLQFALQMPDTLQALRQLYEEHDAGERQPSDDQIYKMLSTSIGQAKKSFLVLDALDECQDRDELLCMIESLATTEQYRICILATSRQDKEIETSLRTIANHIIDVQSAVVDSDIGVYIRDRLSTDKKLQKWPTSVQEEIVTELMKKANGMFRWAFCQLEALRKCNHLRALRKALCELPKDLDETYTRILSGIQSNGDLPDAVTALRWLCFSYRPLRLSELVDVLAIEVKDDGPGRFDPRERMPDSGGVLEICSGLIGWYTSADDDISTDNQDEYTDYIPPSHQTVEDDSSRPESTIWVQLAHFSVKEYLLSSWCFLQSDLQPDTCRMIIGGTCLQYLRYISQQNRISSEIRSTFPLASYSARYWWQYMYEANKVSTLMKPVIDLTYEFLTSDECLSTWKILSDIDNFWIPSEMAYRPNNRSLGSPIHYAVQIGLPDVVQEMISQGADVNATGGYYDVPLLAASTFGHDRVVQILLDAGAELNARRYGNNALELALYKGHDKTVQVLLAAGAEATGEPIKLVSTRGHIEIAHILRDAIVEQSARGSGL